MKVLWTIDSRQGRSQTLRELNPTEIHRQALLQLSSAIIIIFACEVRVEGPDHIPVRIRPILRAFALVEKIGFI